MIGRRIKQMREAHGWTQEELALRMGYKSKSTINKIEKDINDVNQSTINRFAEVFGCDPVDLMVGSHATDRMMEQGVIPHHRAQMFLTDEEQFVIKSMRSNAEVRNFIVTYIQTVNIGPRLPKGIFVKAGPKVATVKAPKGMLMAPKAGTSSIVVKKVSKTRGKRKSQA